MSRDRSLTGESMPHEKRYQQLDALRGLAALTVVFSHFTLLAPLIALRHTPLRVLFGGHEAVILFFTLSGFVLALQIGGTPKPGYGEYVMRRICRVYLPYAVAVIVAYACYALCYAGPVAWAGWWFNDGWPATFPNIELLWHLLFVFPFETSRLDPVLWSLVYEMRISLIFVPVVLLISRVPTWQVIGAAMLLSVAVCWHAIHTGHPVIQASVSAEWLPTLHYLLMFVAGAALARHRERLSNWLRRAPRATVVIIPAASLALYVLSRPISLRVSGILSDYLFDWIVLAAVGGIIASAVALASFARLLQIRPLPFLGAISYSLYLYHAVVLFAVVHLLGERLGVTLSLLIAAALVIPVSYAGYVCVERPAMRLGSRLARRFTMQRALAQMPVRN
ncbi:hypothetical protein BWP39_30970 [Paraburkholderia acidicola]|uniref:Acyltransferase 3 domain-containing protein n=2 Tax=Paraburkholderia acidicola TaxID=1912599 RepID=A0A2A4EVK1_9BURK|nr:hypothetical protein BWP39_30970 [Paraburkholderia acidicola]